MLLTIMSQADSYLQFITVLILFVFVLGITYVTTKWIANYQKGKTAGGNIEVIETHRITSNKYVQILRAGNKYLLIAIGKDEINMLTELSEDEIMLTNAQGDPQMDFNTVLKKVKDFRQKERD